MIMPQCHIRGVRSVELVATNFEEAARFYESVWGLQPVPSRDGARLFRGTGAYHHILGLHHGPRLVVIRGRVRRGGPARRRRASPRGRGRGMCGRHAGRACRRRRRLRLRLRIRMDATSPSSPAAPTTTTPPINPIGRARSRTLPRCPRFRCELQVLHRDTGLPPHRRQCAAVVPALRQCGPLVDRTWRRPTSRPSIMSRSRCPISIRSCAAWGG